MDFARAIGPGWGDPLVGQQVRQIGTGASPVLMAAIIVALVGILIWITQQQPRGGGVIE